MNKKHQNPLVSAGRRSGVLAELALDLRWSWNHSADELWSQLDPELWAFTHNPWVILQTVSWEKLDRLAASPAFRATVDRIVQEKQAFKIAGTWFNEVHPDSPLRTVAYFSMEFMLSEALPIYSGGLGNVAGDQLKAASDLGVPVVGIGLLFQQGYFRQEIDADGNQQAHYPFNDPGQLPIEPLRDAGGEWLRVRITLPGFDLWVRGWQVIVGRTKLFLLDTNDPANLPHHRGIASELYGGSEELRLRQEIVLGIGGWRLLDRLGIRPEVCHLNEGHAAFAVLERARSHRLRHGQPFPLAFAVTRAGNVFTTHTPIDAGFDRFPPELIRRYFHNYAEADLGIPIGDLLALGQRTPASSADPFNMAWLAIRGSGAVNGVSRLHGEVSRRLFQPLFPRWPEVEVPVGHVTNGVHAPTWDSAQADALWTEACGKNRWRGTMETLGRKLAGCTGAALWEMRAAQRACLVDCVRDRLSRQMAARRAAPGDVAFAGSVFDAGTLTLGFARRFATYKRPNLLLRDPGRLLRLLNNPSRPVQLVLGGKAHPRDAEGQRLIQEWVQFARRPEARSRVVFLEDYDMFLTEILVQGVDVWINTPLRPWEACGTSGMKVLVNGGLNLSVLDGWWAEAYAPELGWAIGDGSEHGGNPDSERAEAGQLYRILEEQIVPRFYERDAHGVPAAWVATIRQSMATLTPAFSSNRTVREYTEAYYIPAAEAYAARSRNDGEIGAQVLEWKAGLDAHWDRIRFGECQVFPEGDRFHFEVQVYLDGLNPDSVRIEIYADAPPVREPMRRRDALIGARNAFTYTASVPATRPAGEYTPRAIPFHSGASVPLEASRILWLR